MDGVPVVNVEAEAGLQEALADTPS